ncbi:DUF1692-domain-containing protein [Clavulina sp. PMI_390]|nr:DUF1692-domain-containing protein [Clavulina sp. PMI_390]
MADESEGILAKLDAVAPIQKFDAFPKVQATYQAKSSGGGLWTIIAILASLLLVMNDLHEFVWGWPDHEFAVDTPLASTMVLNVDMVVNMPCHSLSVDLRDSVGERLHLSNGFRRDGTIFDPAQAHALQDWQHKRQVAARDVVSQSRRSRGMFAWFRRGGAQDKYAPTYNYRPDGSACRVYGSVEVKKVTANLHITTLGHGYASMEHTDHSKMNLSHIITEFSFGPHFPDIVQPLDYSFEVTQQHFSVFQYFITVVPTTFHASRSRSVHTNQYSVTHYVKHIEHGQGAPGIFLRYDVDPMAIEVHQRTTLFHDFFIRVAGVIGGVWVCARWAFKVGGKAAEVVTGKKGDDDDLLVQDAKSSSRKSRWTGGSLNKRSVNNGGWDDNSSVVSSPSWTPASPYSAGPYSPSMNAMSPSMVPIPPSPSPYANGNGNGNGHSQMLRTPSGGSSWGTPPPTGNNLNLPPYPPSPLPPTSPSPYSPGAQSGFPPPSPGPYSPSLDSNRRASYVPRASSGLNPNRLSSYGSGGKSGGEDSDAAASPAKKND